MAAIRGSNADDCMNVHSGLRPPLQISRDRMAGRLMATMQHPYASEAGLPKA